VKAVRTRDYGGDTDDNAVVDEALQRAEEIERQPIDVTVSHLMVRRFLGHGIVIQHDNGECLPILDREERVSARPGHVSPHIAGVR
jgi:hypothetical protein